VVNLRFAEAPAMAEFAEPSLVQSLLAPTKEDVLRIVELGVLALLTLIVLMAVVRPLLRRVLEAEPAPPALLAGPALAGADGLPADMPALSRDNPTARLVEFAKINGQVQAETVQRVVDMVRASPTETVEVLRNWIQEN
jgi:flagellar M-ring protein FliF